MAAVKSGRRGAAPPATRRQGPPAPRRVLEAAPNGAAATLFPNTAAPTHRTPPPPRRGAKAVPLPGTGANRATGRRKLSDGRRGFASSLPRTSRERAGRAPARSWGNQLTCFPEPPGQPYKRRPPLTAPGLAAAVTTTEHPGNSPCASSPRGYQAWGRSSRGRCQRTPQPRTGLPAAPPPAGAGQGRANRGADTPLPITKHGACAAGSRAAQAHRHSHAAPRRPFKSQPVAYRWPENGGSRSYGGSRSHPSGLSRVPAPHS